MHAKHAIQEACFEMFCDDSMLTFRYFRGALRLYILQA